MAQFYPLRVSHIEKDTRDAVIVTLEPDAKDRESFRFIQGQYLTFRRDFGGEELRRSYSICAGVNDGNLRVGIKRVDGGWFSTFANEELKVGDHLEAMKPMGNFHATLSPEMARSYLGFAGGSGVTPMISLIKTTLEIEPHSSFHLIYANRSSGSIMFREELADLKSGYLGRLAITHILEAESEIDLFAGILTQEKCEALFKHWVSVDGVERAFICGPEPMMHAVSDALIAHGLEKERIKFELFASARSATPRAASSSGTTQGAEARCVASVILDGVRTDVSMSIDGQSVLDAALEANIGAPYSCKAGVCSTCRARILEGEAEMEKNHALEDYEVERGYVLTCQARPLTDKLVVDFDQ